MPRRPDCTIDQEAVIRQFIGGCEMYDIKIIPEYYHFLMTRLGYKIAPNGARVHMDTPLKYGFGSPDVFEDVFDADGREATNNEIRNNKNTTNAGTGESSKGNTLGRVLRKKV